MDISFAASRIAQANNSRNSLACPDTEDASSIDRFRSQFQRDRDKILHSKAFRRLSHKTQVFIAPSFDHYRTRLTHTLEVSQIARTIARGLNLNEDLTEAVALGHDLGHTPFGHTGEFALRESIARIKGIDPTTEDISRLFRHNVQSLRVVEVLEGAGEGLHLSHEVLNGIVCHTGSTRAQTLEGRIVALSDRIAYINHDIDDALRAGMLKEDELPQHVIDKLGDSHAQRIETLVETCIENSACVDDILLPDEIWESMNELRAFLFERVYHAPEVMKEVSKAQQLISTLFEHYMAHPDQIPDEYLGVAQGDILQASIDYVAGMTDRYARATFEEIFVPQSFTYVIHQRG